MMRDGPFVNHSSGDVWESRWPSWAFRPNEPYGFRGRKAVGLSLSLICQPTSEKIEQHNRTELLVNEPFWPRGKALAAHKQVSNQFWEPHLSV